MQPLDFEVILDFVKELERELDRYVSEFPASSEAILQIIDTCRGMRADLESARLEEVTTNQRRAIR